MRTKQKRGGKFEEISPWKSEDFVYGETATAARMSRDAKWLVWTKSTVDKEKDGRLSNLILSSLTDSTEIELTRGSDHNVAPSWSPNGERIAFLSDRKRAGAKPDTAGMQIWLINPHGGEPWPVTEFVRGPHQIDWLDNDTLIFSAQEDASLFEQEAKKKKDDSQVVDDEAHERRCVCTSSASKTRKSRGSPRTRIAFSAGLFPKMEIRGGDSWKSLRYQFDQKIPPISLLHNLSMAARKQFSLKGECALTDLSGRRTIPVFMLGRRIPPMRDFLPRILHCSIFTI